MTRKIASALTLAALVGGIFAGLAGTAQAQPAQACRTLPSGYVACAPAQSPTGAKAVFVGEDGSASYTDGTAYDPEDKVWR